jgi:hypothetical protein
MAEVQESPEKILGHHLKYEIDQMMHSLQMLGRVTVPSDWEPWWQKALNNALMESFYLHARTLFEFFTKRGSKYTSADYKPFQGFSNATVKEWVRLLNVQAAHMIYDGRTEDDNDKIRDKERYDMLDALRAEVAAFKKSLKSEYKGIDIPDVAAMTRPALAPGVPSATNAIFSLSTASGRDK